MLYMLTASLLFAAMGVCVKLASSQFSAAELVFWRGFIALLLIAAWMRWHRLSPRTEHGRSHLWRSLAGTLALMASFVAITRIPLPTAVTLGYTSPLFLALLLALWLREPVRRPVYLALLLGFAGLVLLLRPTLNAAQWLGAVSGLLCGILSAVAYLNVRTLGRLGEPAWRTVFYFSLATSLAGLPWVLFGDAGSHDVRGALLVFGVGALGALAQVCMTAAYTHGKTLTTASLSYSTVVFSSLFALFLWGESLPWFAYLGMGMILLAGIVASAFSGRHPGVAESRYSDSVRSAKESTT